MMCFFPAAVLTPLRGACERAWSSKNPNGTRVEFNEYYKSLSEEDIEVRWTTASNDPTKYDPRNSNPWLFQQLSTFEGALTPFLASGQEATCLTTWPIHLVQVLDVSDPLTSLLLQGSRVAARRFYSLLVTPT
jgi:hypothetical protein